VSAPYITVDDVQQAISLRKLIQLSNDEPGATAPDMAVVEMVITAASEIVDGYLRARHPARLNPVPTVIRTLTLQLACYGLYARRMESAVPETVKEQRTAAVRLLEHIQSGKVTLGDVETHKAIPEAGAMRIKVPPRQFDEATLSQWRM